ncbi:hypothetical protein, partial [Desulfolutivibrio sp.]|uniref:hypothetical protein n=1 Tax=Desulfolutivibrio sp. TaxID=2773296 RepID=UPI002F967255
LRTRGVVRGTSAERFLNIPRRSSLDGVGFFFFDVRARVTLTQQQQQKRELTGCDAFKGFPCS